MTKSDRIRHFGTISRLTVDQTEAMIHFLDKMGFFNAPASSKYHGSYEGGLFDHSLNVYNTGTLLTGHGEKSVMLCNLMPIELTEEELMCIRYHMGAFVEKEEWKAYTGAIHRYPNVLFTHTADMMAAHLTEVGNND